MSLKTLKELPQEKKNLVLDGFLNAHEDMNFPQEVVALYLDCSPWTLAKMRCEQNALPFTKIGRRISYKKRDVLEYEKNKTVTCTAQLM
ncbi:helix-turn-helix domain-containing protein [Acinetobacter wuhouensis]|uniref:DNA-binding protein n=1 Tax=Acinetobacter wuhouensis TaxID=1879050 RepID=A0A3G2T2X4_9GAMM|nr:helix-turn-helix domain-containing protein [Acinetobacter wuhouensis]AYO54431.1 DNA-binding protein [Acinetobacter wuhouensis]